MNRAKLMEGSICTVVRRSLSKSKSQLADSVGEINWVVKVTGFGYVTDTMIMSVLSVVLRVLKGSNDSKCSSNSVISKPIEFIWTVELSSSSEMVANGCFAEAACLKLILCPVPIQCSSKM